MVPVDVLGGTVSVHVAVGGTEAGGATVGAGVPLATAVGAAVEVGVGVGAGVEVGVEVGVAVGVALGVGVAVAVALGVADGATLALGLGDGSSAEGRISATSRLPLMSVRLSWLPRFSTRPTPCSAARKAVSWVITSSGQAIRVDASGPMAATEPFVVYGPWYVLQPAEPATLFSRNTAVSSVPGSGADWVLGAEAYDPTTQDPRSGFAGAASNTSRMARSGPRIVSESKRML